MPINLKQPIAWTKASAEETVLLTELQANVLHGHVRDTFTALFFSFGDAAEAKSFVRALSPLVKSAMSHLQEIEVFKTTNRKAKGSVYVGVGLTANGYKALGFTGVKVPADASFRKGMKAQRAVLGDPAPGTWDSTFQRTIDAVVVIGDDNAASVNAARAQVLAVKPASVQLIGEETGASQTNSKGVGIEHFGYVDGRSQPLFIKERVDAEAKAKWDPAFPLSQVITPDPAAPASVPASSRFFGSYFVFRKLEQNVRAFKKAEEALAAKLALKPADAERAGAMVVGRFEDGTPVTMQGTDGLTPADPVNDFNYAGDAAGARCPFHGHIRKTNPRGSGGFGVKESKERTHLMARRGQTYGKRVDDPSDESVPITKRPTGGVGLLFMAFNTDIANQFEFTQQSWANSAGFPEAPTGTTPGLDDVIGQGVRTKQKYATKWGVPTFAEGDPFPQAVTMKGGEYFFMPSLTFLRSL
jgi:Dyp-type peroxidase family